MRIVNIERAASNRRLGWLLLGIFLALTAFSIAFIVARSMGRH